MLLHLTLLCCHCLCFELCLECLESASLRDVECLTCLSCEVYALSRVNVKKRALLEYECKTLSLCDLLNCSLSLLVDWSLE